MYKMTLYFQLAHTNTRTTTISNIEEKQKKKREKCWAFYCVFYKAHKFGIEQCPVLSFLCPTPFRGFSLIATLSQMRCDDIEFEGVFIDPNVRPYILIRKMVKIAFSLIFSPLTYQTKFQVLISVQKNLLAKEALWLSYLKDKYSFIRVYINEKEFAFSIDIKAPIFSNGLLKHQTSKNSSVCKKLIRKSMRFFVDYLITTKPGKKIGICGYSYAFIRECMKQTLNKEWNACMPPARGGHIALLFCIYLSAAIREGQVVIALERLLLLLCVKIYNRMFHASAR